MPARPLAPIGRAAFMGELVEEQRAQAASLLILSRF
jgi:hypothetical protein